jgi:hypothetical protein
MALALLPRRHAGEQRLGAHLVDLEGIAIIAREDFLDPAS